MAAGLRTVMIRFVGEHSGLDKASKGALSGMQKFEKGLNVASAAVIGAGVAIGAGLVKVGATWDEAFDGLHIATGAVGDDMEALKGSLKNVVGQTPNDIGLMSDAMGQLNTLTGAAGKPLEDMTVAVAEASRLLGEDASANAAGFGEALRLWGVPADQAAGKMDTIFAATQKWNVGIGDMLGNLTSYGSTLMNVGFSMDDTVALFGQLDAAGLDVSRTMPALNKAFGNWATEGKNVQDEFSNVVDTIKNTSSETEALGIATEVFGSRGAATMVAAIRSGAVEFDNLAGMLEGTEGLIGDTAAETDDWAEKLAKLKNEGMVALEPVASAVFDKLGEGVDILKELVTWGQNNIGMVKAWGIALAAVAGTILLVNAGIKIFHAAMMIKAAIIATVTAVQWLWNIAMTANPIGLIIVGIALLIAGLVLLWKNSETFRNIVLGVWSAISTALKAVWSWISGTLWPGIKGVWDRIVTATKVVWEGVKKYFGFWKGLFSTVIGWVSNVYTRARETFDNVIGFVKKIPGRIEDALSGAADALTAPFRTGFQAAKNFWNDTIGGKGFDIPSWVPGVGGKSFRFPKFHAGGIVPGPAGREVPILAQAGERVLTREQQQDMELPEVHVYIGDRELTDLIDIRVTTRNQATKQRTLTGSGRAR